MEPAQCLVVVDVHQGLTEGPRAIPDDEVEIVDGADVRFAIAPHVL